MKKSLLISLTALAVLGVTTATTLYAQTATGSSVIARMKAAADAFTLSADLNPGQTGYESAPVSGKKTGNMLTAAEWNRMLELVAQGGTGSGGGAGWENVPLTDTADYDTSCLYEVQLKTTDATNNNLMNGDTSWRTGTIRGSKHLGLWFTDGSGYSVWGIQSANKNVYGYRNGSGTFVPVNTVSVLGMRRSCGGGGESGSGGLALYKCTNAQSADVNNAPCFGAKQNQGSGNGRYRPVIAHLLYPSFTPSNLSMFPWHDGTKWKCAISGVGHFDCTDGSVLVVDTQGIGSGTGSTGGDKFTFLDTQIELFSSGLKKTDKTTPTALDISSIAGVTIPANAKAVQLYVYCANYTNQNEGVSLNLGRASTAMLRVCQQNVTGAANDVDTNTVFVPLADDKKTIYYSYTVPSTENGGQVSFFLRGFITE